MNNIRFVREYLLSEKLKANLTKLASKYYPSGVIEIGVERCTIFGGSFNYKHDETPGAYEGDALYANNGAEERLFYCGGGWSYGANAGVFCLNGSNPRSSVYADLGFRSAYVKLPSV